MIFETPDGQRWIVADFFLDSRNEGDFHFC